MKRFLPFAIIAAVLIFALAGTRWYLKHSTQTIPASPTASPEASPPSSPVPGAEPAHVRGSNTAAVMLEEFGDFECAPCGQLYPILKLIESESGPRLRVVFREFPLVPTHEHALAAARTAEAAGMQGKFWEMHDLLYENQKMWHESFDTRAIFEGYAQRIGLDVDRYKRDLTAEVVELRLFLDGKRGHSLGVTGTPTIFINNRAIPSASVTAEGLRAEINKALNTTGP